MDALQGRTFGDRYELAELIGRGGTADTYRAVDKLLGREVAIKLLLDRGDETSQRVLPEARALAALNHPKIVAVYDAGTNEGFSYIVMELMHGSTLRDLEGGSLTYGQAMTYVFDILEALEYAHARGVVHRDIKPSNVVTTGDAQHVKLADFGLAQRAADATPTTETGHVLGTISYLAPERFLSKPADERGDLYSVGMVMYEIFTGTMPFRNDRDDLVATMFSHVHDLPTPAREINRNIPQALEAVIMRAIERDASKRFQNAGEFTAALAGLSAPLQPVAAASDARTPRVAAQPPVQRPEDPSLREALDRALAQSRNRSQALEAVLSGMVATRRRQYDAARCSYGAALNELAAIGSDVEYAKTALKYGTMLLQKASDGLRERSELREGVSRLNDALQIFHKFGLSDQYGETEYLINALERTAIGLY